MFNKLLFLIENNLKVIFPLTILGGSLFISTIPGILNINNSSNQHLFREFNLDKDSENFTNTSSPTSFESFPKVKHNYKTLIKGDTSYNKGNYVIYFGSERCPDCNNFIFNNREKPAPSQKSTAYQLGEFYTTYAFADKSEVLKPFDIKFLMFSDLLPSLDKKNNDDTLSLPWSKWHENDFSRGKIKGDYIRNDKSAVQFREVHNAFQDAFGNTKTSGIPLVAVYKEGVPKIFEQDNFEALEPTFKREDEEAKKNPNQLSSGRNHRLLKYLLYYFGNTFLESDEYEEDEAPEARAAEQTPPPATPPST